MKQLKTGKCFSLQKIIWKAVSSEKFQQFAENCLFELDARSRLAGLKYQQCHSPTMERFRDEPDSRPARDLAGINLA